MLKDVARILVIRGDKIGDVVLCTPAIAALRASQAKAKIAVALRSDVLPVLQGNPHIDELIALDPVQHRGVLGFFRLVREFRRGRHQVVVVLQAPMRVALAAFFAWIPYRIGPLSKWWSWVIYNLGIRQTRSSVEMHEADYNLQLMRDLGVQMRPQRLPTEIFINSSDRESGKLFLEERGLTTRFKTVVIHPGMAGSALNWPERHYVNLARRLLRRYNVVITGGANEEGLVDQVMQKVAGKLTYDPDQPVLTKFVGKDLGKFIGLLANCDAVVAPSTGPMHLAVALKKKVVTVFSPIRVQSAVRWGPYVYPFGTILGVSPEDQATVLVPDVNCGERFRCALSACMYHPCMPRISVEDVETQLHVMLEGGSVSMVKSSAAFLGDQTNLDDDFDEDETIEGQV